MSIGISISILISTVMYSITILQYIDTSCPKKTMSYHTVLCHIVSCHFMSQHITFHIISVCMHNIYLYIYIVCVCVSITLCSYHNSKCVCMCKYRSRIWIELDGQRRWTSTTCASTCWQHLAVWQDCPPRQSQKRPVARSIKMAEMKA